MARARTFSAHCLRRIGEASTIAHDALALEFEGGLSKPGGAGLLQRVGKRAERSAVDQGRFTDSVRDIRSVSSTQTTTAACHFAAGALKKRTGASSAIAPSASNHP